MISPYANFSTIETNVCEFSSALSIWDQPHNGSSDSTDSSPKVFKVVTKPIGYVLGEQLRNMASFFCSIIATITLPSFTLPYASASKIKLCSETSTESFCQASNPCRDPSGAYKETCHNREVTYLSGEKTCRLTTNCDTGSDTVPSKSNQIKYKPSKIPVLENNGGTLTIMDLLENPVSPEVTNDKLNQNFEAIKQIDQELVNLASDDPRAEKFKLQKAELYRNQGNVIGNLKGGEVITVDYQQRTFVIAPENSAQVDHLYSPQAIDSFQTLAKSTGGIMGLSPSPQLLGLIIEVVFEHILHAAQSYEGLDVAVVFDTTGSMQDDLEQVRIHLSYTLKRIKNENNPAFRVALIEYRDNSREDVFLNRVHTDFTSDLDHVSAEVNRVDAYGGGDDPEAVFDALLAVRNLSWRENTMHAVLIVGDAPPHERTVDNRHGINDVIELYTNKDIRLVVYPIITNK